MYIQHARLQESLDTDASVVETTSHIYTRQHLPTGPKPTAAGGCWTTVSLARQCGYKDHISNIDNNNNISGNNTISSSSSSDCHRMKIKLGWSIMRNSNNGRVVQEVLDKGISSLAVCLKHSFLFPEHEQQVGELAASMGFTQISLSSQVMPMVKMVPRGYTAAADAYLTPHIMRYMGMPYCLCDADSPVGIMRCTWC